MISLRTFYKTEASLVGYVFAATLVVALGTGMTLPGDAHAASIRQLSVAQMLDRSALVVEARVTAVDTDAARSGRRGNDPWTAVTLAVTDTVKGFHASEDLTLHYFGGARNGQPTFIPGMTVPAVGDEGVFFLAAPSEKRLNPVVGWSQGHFRIDKANGFSRITTQDGAPVRSVSGEDVTRVLALSNGTARGVTTMRSRAFALSPSAFKRSLRTLLATGGSR